MQLLYVKNVQMFYLVVNDTAVMVYIMDKNFTAVATKLATPHISPTSVGKEFIRIRAHKFIIFLII